MKTAVRVPPNWQHPRKRGELVPMTKQALAARWPEAERTHWQLYERMDGIPVSPVFPTPDALAEWAEATRLKAFGGRRATKGAWLELIEERADLDAWTAHGMEWLTDIECRTNYGVITEGGRVVPADKVTS